jgi:hypothetical protein
MDPELSLLLSTLRENIASQHKYYNEVLSFAMKKASGELSNEDKKLMAKLPLPPAPVSIPGNVNGISQYIYKLTNSRY